ncbi:ATP-binding cassette domain-containing protein [Bizionia sediminis]|uniref:ATP-binding cassette domain-containing protein n=1 Tax=Bizionia sediminis TaxID=1737064 RepID=A0ABW5KMP3_9FLAO
MTLELDNVELYFNRKCILNGVYLKAQTGQVTGILGRNGCGKSCILNIIFGSLLPKYKLIRLNNKPITKPLYQTNMVRYLPQFSATPNNLKLQRAFHFFKISWLEFITHFPTFEKYKQVSFRHLSGGERRIIELYLILMSRCKVVLLDEPFSHIAPVYVARIKQLINQEKAHKIIIITDHLFRDIIDISDRLYLIKNGHTKLVSNLEELENQNYITSNML